MKAFLLALLLCALPATALTPMTLGDMLKGYRTHFGLTQTALARLSGVSATRISRMERGLDSIPASTAVRLAKPLDSIFRARYPAGTELWLMNVIARARRP